jgi:hypothetical protein
VPRLPSLLTFGARRRAVTGALASGLLVAVLAGAGPAAAATSPAALVTASQAAAAKQQSVRFAASSSLGSDSITIVADVARSAGLETVRIRHSSQVGLVSARYTGKAVYFKGNVNGLVGYMGMPSALATKYAGRWIAFTPTQKNYAAIAHSMTLPAAVAQVSIDPPFTTSAGPKVGNLSTVVVHGTTTSLSSSGGKGSATLSIRSQGTPLPVRFVGKGTQSGGTESGQVVFSRWGEPVNVATPSPSVNASTITNGTSGSSGSSSSSSAG